MWKTTLKKPKRGKAKRRPITEDTKQSIVLRLAIKFFFAISSEPTEKVAKVLYRPWAYVRWDHIHRRGSL